MSIILKGIDLPKDGTVIHLIVQGDGKTQYITIGDGKLIFDKEANAIQIPKGHGRMIDADNIDYELRTTVVKPLHDAASIQDMGVWLGALVVGKQPKRLFLQKFVDRESVLFAGLSAALPEEMQQLSQLLTPFCEQVSIRGE